MGFKIKHGSPSSITKLAKLAGQAKASIKQQEMSLRMAQQVSAEANRMEMAKFKVQAGIEAEKRDISWQIEKAELYKRNKLEMAMQLDNMETMRQQEERVRKEDWLRTKFEEIEKDDRFSSRETEDMKLQAESRINVGFGIRPPEEKEKSILSALTDRMATPTGGASKEELRRLGTKEAYEEGKRLGYWR